MDVESFRAYCLAKKGVTEGLPFGPEVLVFKVMGKMFALLNLDGLPARANLKGDPEEIPDLREQWPDIILPGYHMNKQHWNTVLIERIPEILVLQLTDKSYNLVVNSLPKKIRQELEMF
jgi:predicted DNA-binding protein (MmcQ/YjbR family)